MKLTKALIEAVGEDCQCGRKRLPLHCPKCGLRTIYARNKSAEVLNLPDIGKVVALGFKCRRCGTCFNEATPCEAPAPVSHAKTIRRHLKVGSPAQSDMEQIEQSLDATTPEQEERLQKVVDMLSSRPERRDAIYELLQESSASKR